MDIGWTDRWMEGVPKAKFRFPYPMLCVLCSTLPLSTVTEKWANTLNFELIWKGNKGTIKRLQEGLGI